MTVKNAFYAQSGGVTAVINATACGLIQEARRHPDRIGRVYAGRDGIIGALTEDLIDTAAESDADIARLRHTPGGAFGSCRFKLKSLDQQRAHYERLMAVFAAHDIGYFFYNGGNDSMDTAQKVSQFSRQLGYPLTCIGIPKTIDNDLPLIDSCPGFGSVAKYVATSMREAGFDVASMARNSTRIFVMEVMGRHAGWITAACGLASEAEGEPPHILLFPEIAFDAERFLARVGEVVARYGYCTVAVSEGLQGADGKLLAESGNKDAFGHAQLGGVGQMVAQLIQDRLGLKYHWALADYLQRSARHIASRTDLEQAVALGEAAVRRALSGSDAVMMTVERLCDTPYRWQIGEVPLSAVANVERKMPVDFISPDGFHITEKCRAYLRPLIEGEEAPPFKNGLPDYVRLNNQAVPRKLEEYQI